MQNFHRLIGVLGGLGPKTTAEFYEKLVQSATRRSRPAVCIWSLPMNIQKEVEYISHGEHREYYMSLLEDGLLRLVRAGSSSIVIPCNTVHEFHERLQRKTSLPIMNIIDVVGDEIMEKGWKRVALLTTSRTRKTRLYQNALKKRGIEWVFPSRKDQLLLDQLIQGLLGNTSEEKHQQFLGKLLERMGEQNVVLGCTDLQLVHIPSSNVIDSLAALVQRTSRFA